MHLLFRFISTSILLIFISSAGLAQTHTHELSCYIADTRLFLKNMMADGTKKVECKVSGLNDQSSVKDFIPAAGSAVRIKKVKVGRLQNDGCRKVWLTMKEQGSMNDFRLMLMAANVKTIIAAGKTFEVLYLPVKNSNPFE